MFEIHATERSVLLKESVWEHMLRIPPSTPAEISAKYSLLTNRNFVLLWLGQSISVLGDTIFNLTLILWVALILAPHQSWAPLAVSGIMFAATLPYVIVGPLAGVFVDLHDRRRTMLAIDILRALLILLLLSGVLPVPFLLTGELAPETKLGITCIVVFLVSTCTQFFTPARVALTGELVEEQQRVQASSLEQITQSLTMIIGPLLAPPLLLAFGLQWALLINALSFVLSWCTVVLISTPAETRNMQSKQAGSLRRAFRDGLSFSFGHRVIRALVITLLLGMLGVGAFNTLYVFFFLQNLHAPAMIIGLVDAIFGAGIVLGAIGTGLFTRYLSLELVLVFAGILAGGAFIALACTTNIVIALFFIALTGVCQGGLGVALWPMVLKVTPPALLGRVSALFNTIPTLAELLGAVLAGYLAGSIRRNWHVLLLGFPFGSIASIFLVAGLLILLAALYLLRSMKVRGNPCD